MPYAQKITILVVDYHTIVCSGIAEILRRFQDFEVLGHVGSGVEALSFCEQNQPDVVSIDVDLPGEIRGLDVIRMLRSKHPKIRAVVLTNISDEITIQAALRTGAISYLLKNISPEELAHAIRSSYQGQSTLSPEVTQTLIRALSAPTPAQTNLTRREYQVLELITRGRTNHEIAAELNISFSTVQFHVRNILSKLGVHNRIEAATFAVRQELGPPSHWVLPS